VTRADWAAAPSFDTCRTAGNEVGPEVVNPSTMFCPNAPVDVVLLRSGEMAPLNTWNEELVTLPLCSTTRVAGLISYQRTSERAAGEVFVACWVQSPTVPAARDGSIADTAWVGRASSVSSCFAEFGNPLL
jgi:hypothetical protein